MLKPFSAMLLHGSDGLQRGFLPALLAERHRLGGMRRLLVIGRHLEGLAPWLRKVPRRRPRPRHRRRPQARQQPRRLRRHMLLAATQCCKDPGHSPWCTQADCFITMPWETSKIATSNSHIASDDQLNTFLLGCLAHLECGRLSSPQSRRIPSAAGTAAGRWHGWPPAESQQPPGHRRLAAATAAC